MNYKEIVVELIKLKYLFGKCAFRERSSKAFVLNKTAKIIDFSCKGRKLFENASKGRFYSNH